MKKNSLFNIYHYYSFFSFTNSR